MNCSHSGNRLGQMLYTIVSRLRIVHKVGFSLHYYQFGLLTYDCIDRSDMSHVITQKTILRCYKNSRFAINSRPGLVLMSSAVRSGRYLCVLTVGISAYLSLIISARCLAHIINLAAQAVISARSKSKYYNGDLADDHLPEDLSANERDEIGIVRAICVKVGTVFLV